MRDKLVNGELDAAHVLYGLICGVQMGIGGPKKEDMFANLMTLNNNGQAITLSNQMRDKGRDRQRSHLAKLPDRQREKDYTFAQTFPDRHPRHVAVLLAGGQRRQSAEGRQDDHRAAAADGGQHARRQHGRFLRRRTVEQTARSWTTSASPR